MQAVRLYFADTEPMQANEDLPARLVKPEITGDLDNPLPFRAGMKYSRILRQIEEGRYIVAEGSFGTALALYSWVRKRTSSEHPVYDHASSRVNRSIFAARAGRIMVRVKDHHTELEKAPAIPWLKTFYPGNREFLITLPDLLGLNGAWQWYSKGIKYPVLDHRMHPFYGVYFPTRTTHLLMLEGWLERNTNNFSHVTDIGTGCGVLGFMALKHGAVKVTATDINPNAIYSTLMDAKRLGLQKNIKSEQACFFGTGKEDSSADRGLTIFNPPWIPGKSETLIDKGVYYEDGFFEELFAEAAEKIKPGGSLVIIFSDYAIVAGIATKNPIEEAVAASRDFIIEDKLTSKVSERTGKPTKSWINSIREKETVELWIIKRR